MPYVDNNTPVIEKITLPSGNTYFIADRQIRDVVDALSDTVAGGGSYTSGWDGTSEPTVGNIPAGVTVTYNGTDYTGTLTANNATPGAFYLVKSGDDAPDIYSEYVPVGPAGNKTWEKLGDTQIDLTDIVTNVTLDKQTASVIGADSTFTITQPTISLSAGTTSGTGKVEVVTDVTSTTATGDNVTALTGLGTPSTDTFLKGVQVTSQPTVTLTANTASETGRITYVQSVGAAATTHLSASASGGSVSASGDTVAAVTSLGAPSTQPAVKSVSPTTKKLATGSVTGVQSTTTTASKAGSASITYADGTDTASNVNTNILKGMSVSNGTLVFGACTLDTATESFTDVTVPIKAASATTVATGSVTTSGSGADVVTDVSVGDTFNAVTGYTPETDDVIGTGTTFNVTDPSVTIASGGTGDVTVATGNGTITTRYLSAAASGTAVGANGTGDAITGITPTTDTVLGTGSTITVTPEKKYITGTATGANTAWNSKDAKTVLTNATDVDVTKGS